MHVCVCVMVMDVLLSVGMYVGFFYVPLLVVSLIGCLFCSVCLYEFYKMSGS